MLECVCICNYHTVLNGYQCLQLQCHATVHYHNEIDDPGPLLPAAWNRTISPISTIYYTTIQLLYCISWFIVALLFIINHSYMTLNLYHVGLRHKQKNVKETFFLPLSYSITRRCSART